MPWLRGEWSVRCLLPLDFGLACVTCVGRGDVSRHDARLPFGASVIDMIRPLPLPHRSKMRQVVQTKLADLQMTLA